MNIQFEYDSSISDDKQFYWLRRNVKKEMLQNKGDKSRSEVIREATIYAVDLFNEFKNKNNG